MSKSSLIPMLLLAAAFALPAVDTAHASTCVSKGEREAFYVQSVLTDLSEAGFTCSKPDEYADFKARFQGPLSTYSSILEKRFRTDYGKVGSQKFNTYLTDLANRASLRSAIKRSSFCTRAQALYSGTREMSPAQLGEYAIATANAETDVPKDCRRKVAG